MRRTTAQHKVNVQMKTYWRVHCHKTFGGWEWLCFLIALGDFSGRDLVGVVNAVMNRRVLELTGRNATHTPPADARLSARGAAAVLGQELPPVRGPAQKVSEAKKARHHANNLENKKRSLIVPCLLWLEIVYKYMDISVSNVKELSPGSAINGFLASNCAVCAKYRPISWQKLVCFTTELDPHLTLV